MTFGGVSFFKAFTLQTHDRLLSNGLIRAGVRSYVLQDLSNITYVLFCYSSTRGQDEGGQEREEKRHREIEKQQEKRQRER